jgi:hypothetical protein
VLERLIELTSTRPSTALLAKIVAKVSADPDCRGTRVVMFEVLLRWQRHDIVELAASCRRSVIPSWDRSAEVWSTVVVPTKSCAAISLLVAPVAASLAWSSWGSSFRDSTLWYSR